MASPQTQKSSHTKWKFSTIDFSVENQRSENGKKGDGWIMCVGRGVDDDGEKSRKAVVKYS